MANDTEYGLSGSIFTNDLGRGLRVARGVEAGNLSVNSHSSVRYWTPFGGYKQSGLGRELGPDAPMAFTEEKNVFIATELWAPGGPGTDWAHVRRALSGHMRSEQGSSHDRTDPGPRGGRHRRLLGHRAGDRAAVRRRGRQGGDRRHRRRPRCEIVVELGAPPSATYVHVDVTNKDEVDALFASRQGDVRAVDIAFNNAGISPPDDDSILDTELEAGGASRR